MHFFSVEHSTARGSRALRYALAGGIMLSWALWGTPRLPAADPPPTPNAPAMPDDAPAWAPAPGTSSGSATGAGAAGTDKSKSTAAAAAASPTQPPPFPGDDNPAPPSPAVSGAAGTGGASSAPTPTGSSTGSNTTGSNSTGAKTTGSNSNSANSAGATTAGATSAGANGASTKNQQTSGQGPDGAASGSTPPNPNPGYTPPNPPAPNSNSSTAQPNYFDREDLVSVQLRASGISGQGPVQDASIFPVEAFPFFLMDHQLYFSDLRFYPTVDGTFGGSVGVGYRLYNSSLDRVFGISGWYDGDGTRDPYLQQLGLSLETYGKWWDFRTNLYLPIGETYYATGVSAASNSAKFVGNNVVYDQLQGYISAMGGADVEFGVPIPGKFFEDHKTRVYGGWYYFVDNQGDHIAGGSARLQANLYKGWDGSVQVTNDNFFNTRAFVGLSWTFGPLHSSEISDPSEQSRLGEHVNRNYTVLAPTRTQTDPNVVAVDPDTGSPYTFAHVNSAAAAGGNGSINSPYQTLAAASASDATIIFVHANSVFSGANASVNLSSGEVLLGDGAGLQHTISVAGGTLILPHSASSTSLPILESSNGNAITLSPGVIVSGFVIESPAQNGIFGNGANGASIANVTISNAGANGIELLNTTGSASLSNITINNSVGNGLYIQGGTANITVSGSISGSQQYDVAVAGIGGGTIDLTGLSLPGSNSQGVLLFNNAGTVEFNNLNVLNSAGRGIDIENESGTVQFSGTTTVSGAAAESVYINSLLSTGEVTFDNLAISHREGPGLSINQSSGTVSVTGTTNITNESGSNASGISIANSSGNTTFTGAATVSNAASNPGVSLTSNTGATTFGSLNVTSVNGTGLYANQGGTLVINSAQTSGAGGTITSSGGTAVDIENTNMNVYLAAVSSNNAAAGIKLIADPGYFYVTGNSSNAAGTGGTIQNDTIGVIAQNSGTIGLAGMTLTGNGVGIQAQSVQTLGIASTTISGSTSYGVQALNVGTLSLVTDTFSGNGAAPILSQYNQIGAYTVQMASSTITSSNADNLLIQALSGSEGSTLNLTVQTTAFNMGGANTAGINVGWNGNLTATIEGNSFAGTGGTNTGVLINNASTVYNSTITIESNEFAANGGNDVGFHIITAGPSSITIAGNSIQFGATNGTGMEFSLGSGGMVELDGNEIYDNKGGATGFKFDSVTGPSAIELDSNTFSVPNGGGPDSGIVFTNVTDPVSGGVTYMVSIASEYNNTISGASTILSIPASTTSGTFLINNTEMQ